MTEEEQNAKALNDVSTYGCHVLKVFGDESGPPFCYSIGIEATSHQPDLIVVGLKPELGHWIINEYNDRVRLGEVFQPDRLYEGFLEGFPVAFSPMLKQHYREHLGWGLWFYQGADFRVFQLVYPNTSGQWPWDPGASDDFRRLAPLLCERPKLT